MDRRPRWLADEMLGRLGRYLRFFGHDTEYVRGLQDVEVLAELDRTDRVLLTRDRALAKRTPRAFLLKSPEIAEQLREIRRGFPDVSFDVRFDRCSLCNGALSPSKTDRAVAPPGSDSHARPAAAPAEVFVCGSCGHQYWEGSHTARVRASVRRWMTEDV